MATLRCSSSFFVRLVLWAIVVLAGFAAGTSVTCADDARPSAQPRPLMRMPRWIESLTPRTARQQRPQAPHSTPRQAAQTPAAPATASPTKAIPDDAEEGTTQLTAGWTDLVPEKKAAQPSAAPADPANTSTAEVADQTTTETEVEPAAPAETAPAVLQPPAAPPAADETATTTNTTARSASPTDAPAIAPAADDAQPTAEAAPAVVPAAVPAAAPTDVPVAAPVATPPDDSPALAIDPASFRGVYPGKTTREELLASWGAGEAFSREDGSQGLFWKIEPFERVEVAIDNDTVATIRIQLAEPVAVGDLAKQLEIADLRMVSVLDEKGVSIGEVFPERGVVFSVKPGTQSAVAVMLEPLDPESFVLRAEGELEKETDNAVADLRYALQLDPNHLRAIRLLLSLHCDQGQWQDAKALAERAVGIDPQDIWTQFKHADVLMALEQAAAARATIEAVLGQPNASPLVVAQAERLLGRIELAAEKPDYQKAVEHFGTAIRTATPLVGNKSVSVQQAARDVLLDAHLGTALSIAKGTWQQKARVIPKWITRSETIVNELNPNAGDKDALELRLCRGALAVAAGSVDSIDPLPWVKRLLEVRSRVNDKVTDDARRRQLDWEIGQGLTDALLAAQKRGDAADMLENCTLTAAYLERGAEHRQLTDTERKNVGELMFRIGILHSLQQGDHATAVTWFDKALPLWDGNPAFSRSGDVGRLGESFVSMAISYWQVDRRDDAVTISNKGVNLMVQAVDQQQLDERSLAVAYGNLSTMYAEKGDDEKSRTYAEMASRAEASGTVLK